MKPITLGQIEELLRKQEERLEKQFGKKFTTKNDLKLLATKEDLKAFATKNDLKITEGRLEEGIVDKIKRAIQDSEAIVISSVDKNKVDIEKLSKLEARVTKLEQAISS